MKNTKLMSLVILTSALGWLSIAQANVDEIPFQGYVLQNGTVIDGDKSVVFELAPCTDATDVRWTETQTVTFDTGIFSVALGSTEPFTSGLFEDDLCLNMDIDGDVLSSPLSSVPTAIYATTSGHATVADSLGSSVGSIQGLLT